MYHDYLWVLMVQLIFKILFNIFIYFHFCLNAYYFQIKIYILKQMAYSNSSGDNYEMTSL